MHTAYEKLIEHLDAHEVRYVCGDESQSIFADFRGSVATYRLVALVDDETELFQVFVYGSVRVPEGARPGIAEAIARANYGMRVGKFELDMGDGELRFHVAQIISAESLDDDMIQRTIGTAITMLDTYLPAYLSIIYGNELPADAIRQVESDWNAFEDEQ